MAQVHAAPRVQDSLNRPPCARCGAQTWLTRIERSGEPDHELFTFECPVCEITQDVKTRVK